MMQILAISGSLRAVSSNTTILKALAALADNDAHFTFYEGLASLPHFNPDIEKEGIPGTVVDFRRQLQAADGIVICTPEYAFGVPGVLKNALDWIVSSGEFDKKPVATISVSPLATGGETAHASLLRTLQVMGAAIAEKASLSIPLVSKRINEKGELTDDTTRQELIVLFNALKETIAHTTQS